MNLAKWQLVSFVSRGVAMGLGIFQSFFIVRLLTVGDYGIVQLAAAVGGAFGIYQHLGLSSGSTREISAAKDDTEVFKIFITSVVIRYMVTIPIAVGLFFGASRIAVGQYEEPALIMPLQIYAVVLMIQGVQGMMNSVVAGTKRFKHLFLYQAGIAVVSVCLYIPLVYLYGINGFFYAMLGFNLIATLVLGSIAFIPLRGTLVMPGIADFKRLLKELLSISLAIYAIKVIYTMWEKSGPILLGYAVSVEALGIFAFALLFAKKLTHISDAVTDVNLPVLSDKYVHNFDEFKALFVQNFNKIFVLLVFSAVAATFWSSELIRFVVGGNKYDASLPLILPLVFTFVFYSLVNIIVSSIFIPAKYVFNMITGFLLVLGVTVGVYFGLGNWSSVDYLLVMTYALFSGMLVGLVFLVLTSHYKLKFNYVTHDHLLILVQAFFIASAKDALQDFWHKIGLFIVFSALYMWGVYIAKFITREDLLSVKAKLSRFV